MINFDSIITQVLTTVTEQVGEALVQTNEEARIWPNISSGKTTVRRNPNAPMRKVKQYRDNIDYGEMQESIQANVVDGKGIVEYDGVNDEKLTSVLAQKPILDVVDAEFDYDAAIDEALKLAGLM